MFRESRTRAEILRLRELLDAVWCQTKTRGVRVELRHVGSTIRVIVTAPWADEERFVLAVVNALNGHATLTGRDREKRLVQALRGIADTADNLDECDAARMRDVAHFALKDTGHLEGRDAE